MNDNYYVIVIKIVDIIKVSILILHTNKFNSSFTTTLSIRFLKMYEGGSGRGQFLKHISSHCKNTRIIKLLGVSRPHSL